MSDATYDLAVIGAGPGGYVAGIRAAQHGLSTVIIEAENLGGECLNHGCIPSKALIHAADHYAGLDKLKTFGITVEGAAIDYGTAVKWKDRIVKRLTTGVGTLLKAAGATIIEGRARFVAGDLLEVETAEGVQRIHAAHTIIATGARSIEIPALPFDGQTIIDNRAALALTEIPPRLIVIGGGYIGLEMGIVFAKLSSRVTVVELTEALLPTSPSEAVKVVERNLRRMKIKTMLGAKATGVTIDNSVAALTVCDTHGNEQVLEAEKILVTVGRRPNTENLGLENTKVTLDQRGFIEVDPQRRTSDEKIWAIGDVAGGLLLAHKASAEALVAADAIAGKETIFAPQAIAAVVFTDPEIATVGLTVEEAKEQGIVAAEAEFPFLALGRSLTMNNSDGYCKWIFRSDDHTILGCEIVGPEASNLIGEGALAVEKQLKLEDIAGTIHAHPTLPEALAEAADLGLGHPLHLPKK